MQSFIYDVLKQLKHNNVSISKLTFIVPSKRAGLFLKHELSKVEQQTIFAPAILSIEEFVSSISQLQSISNTELLFEFYSVYKTLTKPAHQDAFVTFSKWAQIVLQDFNEVDRYLIEPEAIFTQLSAIKAMERWSVDTTEPTPLVNNYITFWNRLIDYYKALKVHLVEQGFAYQGLQYREAVEQLEHYIQAHPNNHYVFLGFNALNTAEETIIQELLQQGLADIFWDAEHYFINNKKHDAGLFIRRYLNDWNYFETHDFNWINTNYSAPKNCSIYGVPKQVSQAKQIGLLLKQLQLTNPNLEGVAVVLADENLLIPVLNSIPKGITALNITMGFPLKSIALAPLFTQLFELHKLSNERLYYKTVINIIAHESIAPLLSKNNSEAVFKAVQLIRDNNLVYLDVKRLKTLFKDSEALINLLFAPWASVRDALTNCFEILLQLKHYLNEASTNNQLALEYTYRFYNLFVELQRLQTTHEHITDVTTLYQFYKELLSNETLDFNGEPLQGLQIMGMLESRVLDFETVIIASVNEGILPAGKSNNSYIPFDVKCQYSLPTFKEKDAIYTYHFYRLLQRASNIHILYNTEIDSLTGGEKSRFINQLLIDNVHDITHTIVSPKVPKLQTPLLEVETTEAILSRLQAIAKKGFSPSSLTTYIRNPIDFYTEKVLGIKRVEEVEETVAFNTLGTVVHNTLEAFYKPFTGTLLTVDKLKQLKPKVDNTVKHYFKEAYKEGDVSTGKNRIVFEIAKQYVINFINLEIRDIEAGNAIKIIAIETKNQVAIDIPELDFKVCLTGIVDRVDEYNGVLRIIDYKTGKVEQNKVEVVDWELIHADYDKYSKSFQILTYAYMMYLENKVNFPFEAGIISFKNLQAGVLKFATKPSSGSRQRNILITEDTLHNFETQLKQLILEICDINKPFTEKEI